jgi:hypothetical protein
MGQPNPERRQGGFSKKTKYRIEKEVNDQRLDLNRKAQTT